MCLKADPDRPLTLAIGGERIVPGECVEAPTVDGKRNRGGRMLLELEDGRAQKTQSRRVSVRPGREVVVTAGRKKIEVVERKRCSGLP